MFDADGSGSLDMREVKSIVTSIYASKVVQDNIRPEATKAMQVLDGMDVDGDGNVSKAEFVAMVKNYHYMLLPAFILQKKVREKLFGSYINWADVEEERRKSDGMSLIDVVKRIDVMTNDVAVQGKADIATPDGRARLLKQASDSGFTLANVKDGMAQHTLDTNAKTGVMDQAEYVSKKKQAAESNSMKHRHSAHKVLQS
jgi:hypothetical protein